MTATHPYSSMFRENDDASHSFMARSTDSSKLSMMPPSPRQELGRVETDSMKMVRESPTTAKQHRHHGKSSRRSSRAPTLDSRADGNSRSSRYSLSGEIKEAECRDESELHNSNSIDDGRSISGFISDIHSTISATVSAAMSGTSSLGSSSVHSKIPVDKMTYWSSLQYPCVSL